jgi:protease-4
MITASMDQEALMKNFLYSFAGTLSVVVLLVAVTGGYAACVSGKKSKIESTSWLEIELQGELLEYDPPGGIMSQISGGDVETLQRVLDNLAKAAADERIEGVILKVAMGGTGGRAKREEMRNAIRRVRDSGKKVYAWAESFNRNDYHLIAACDEVITPPTSYINFTGVAFGSTHVAQALKKLGIRPNIHKIKDYKSAAELVLREDMSEPAREMSEWLLDEMWQMTMQALEADRGLSEEQVVAVMERASLQATEAKELGLVDRIAYWDEVEALLKGDDDELETVSASRYAQESFSKVGLKGKKRIAVIHAQGMIAGRESGVNPLLGMTMGHETIVAELRRARLDDKIEAVILRVDSPGGEALASDLMGHEVEITTAVKPVVVSMVDVAASGGYHISYRASRILADPMTITGSIGSISGKFNIKGLHDKLGITHDFVTRGPMALYNSSYHDYTEAERARFEEDHWAGFNDWLRDVSEHRGMSFEEAELLAHGRVWSGRQAKANGLVDELGDLHRAVEVAKELAEIPADEQVRLKHYPKKKTLLESLMEGQSATAARWAVYRAVRKDFVQTLDLIAREPGLVLQEAYAP